MRLRVGYIRVSSDKQDSSRQKESLASLALDCNYVDDVGRNPRDQPDKRPEFQRLLSDVRAGKIAEIYVDRQDRFGARDSYQFSSFINLLRDHQCQLFDATGKSLSSNDDVTVLTNAIGSLASRKEQQEKAHRNVSGKASKAKLGLYQGGYAPYGLDVVCFRAGVEVWRVVYTGQFDRLKIYPNGDAERFSGKGNFPASNPEDELRLRPNPERAKVVKQIFEWYNSERISAGAIAKRLEQQGVDPVFGHWLKQKVAALLRNPVYTGLPTWNKRGGSRFSELVGGKIQTVTDTRLGRNRATSDYIQPEQAQFEPIISPELFAQTQARIEAGKTGKLRKANTAALWLRPFLRCGKCGATMHASMNTARNRIVPSYFCSTYNQRGPSACKCHRVAHSVVEALVVDYLKQVEPKIEALLSKPVAAVAETNFTAENKAYFDVACDMLAFEAMHGETGSYAEIYARVLPEIQSQLEVKEAELNKLLDDYATLPVSVRHRINSKLELLESEIADLKRQSVDLTVPMDEAYQQLQLRKAEVAEALNAIATDSDFRQRTEAVGKVIDSITLHYTYAGPKSYLDRIDIVAASGETVTKPVVIKDASPAPN